MDFAKRQLEKYGWKEGKGLGKNEDGLATALQAKLKFDNTGVGHEQGKDFTYKWWENVYDNAANNIKVSRDHEDIKVQRVADEVEITTKDYSVRNFKKKNGDMEYGTFLKTAKLTENGVVHYDNVQAPSETDKFKIKEISDEELFAICGGRTAHKGARHGLTLSGKLARIEKQEKLLAKKLKKVKIEDNNNLEDCAYNKKLNKLKKHSQSDIEEPSTSRQKLTKEPLKKKKHKRKKSVSFSETVVEYTISEPEPESQTTDESIGCSPSSSDYTSPKHKVEVHALNDNNNYINDPVTTDEGIEQDCEVYENRGQQSFSEMQIHKKDKKKKKKQKKAKAEKQVEVETVEQKEFVMKSKWRSNKRISQDVDIDLIKKIKRKKSNQQNKEISDLSDGLEEFRLSD